MAQEVGGLLHFCQHTKAEHCYPDEGSRKHLASLKLLRWMDGWVSSACPAKFSQPLQDARQKAVPEDEEEEKRGWHQQIFSWPEHFVCW